MADLINWIESDSFLSPLHEPQVKVNFTSFSLKACDLANVRSVDLHPLIQVMKPEQTPKSA